MSGLIERTTTVLNCLPVQTDGNLSVAMALEFVQDKTVTTQELLEVMVQNDLLGNIRSELEWHVAMHLLRLKTKALSKLQADGFKFEQVLLSHLKKDIFIIEDGITKPFLQHVASQTDEKLANQDDAKLAEHAAMSPKMTEHVSTSPKSAGNDGWRKVSTGMQKKVHAVKKIAVHQLGTEPEFIDKTVAKKPTGVWVVPNGKEKNDIDHKPVASAGYVFFPSNPPRSQDDDMFSWKAIIHADIGTNTVVIPWRRGIEAERGQAGWHYTQCDDFPNSNYVGWYQVKRDFHYQHYMTHEGVWEHYYINDVTDKNDKITDEEMYNIVRANLWQAPRKSK